MKLKSQSARMCSICVKRGKRKSTHCRETAGNSAHCYLPQHRGEKNLPWGFITTNQLSYIFADQTITLPVVQRPFVCKGGHNKIPQSRGLNSGNCFLIVLEARSPTSRFLEGWFLVRGLFSLPHMAFPLCTRGERERELWCLFLFL